MTPQGLSQREPGESAQGKLNLEGIIDTCAKVGHEILPSPTPVGHLLSLERGIVNIAHDCEPSREEVTGEPAAVQRKLTAATLGSWSMGVPQQPDLLQAQLGCSK